MSVFEFFNSIFAVIFSASPDNTVYAYSTICTLIIYSVLTLLPFLVGCSIVKNHYERRNVK